MIPRFITATLSRRLIVAMLLVTVPAILVAIVGLSRTTTRYVRNEAIEDLGRSARVLAEKVNGWADDLAQDLQFVAHHPDLVSLDPTRQRAMLLNVLKAYPQVTYAHIIDLNGMNTARGDNLPMIDYHDRQYFRRVIDGAPTAYETLLKSRSTGRAALNLAAPIAGPDGKVLGVLVFGMGLSYLAETVGAGRYGATGYSCLVDEEGRALARPGLNDAAPVQDLRGLPPVRRVLQDRSPFFSHFQDKDGVWWLSHAVPTANGWSVITLQQESEVLAGAHLLALRAAFIMTATIAVMILLIWFVAARTMRPVGQMTRAAHLITGGNWGQRLPEGRSDELGELSQAFNKMLDHLERTYHSIEEEVRLRTCELSAANILLNDQVEERKRAETTLLDREERIRLLLDSTYEAVFGINMDGECTFANRACVQLLGYQNPSDLLGKKIHALIHHSHADGSAYPRENCPTYRASKTGEESHVDNEVYWRADGSCFPVEYWSHPVLRENQIVGVVVTFLDITQRRVAEQDLRVRMAAMEATDDGIIITNRAGIIEHVNPSFSRATGYSYEEVIGRTPAFLKSGCHDAAFYDRLWQTILSGQVWRGEITNRRKDGTLFEEETSISPVFDEAGEIVHFVAIKQDVTERRKAQQIESERNTLREAVQAMEKVLGVVGHELRTPLAGIRAMAELLLSQNNEQLADEHHFLKAIGAEVVQMSSLVNDMLEVARLNSGVARWNWGSFRVADACREAVSAIDPLIDHERISLLCEVDPSDLEMQGDAAAVRRLVLNLLSNAQKHTSEGEISVRAWWTAVEDVEWIELCVRDSGSGIAPEIAEKVGEAFALNSGIIGEEYVKGSGLGLAICKGIIAAHGGSMRIESRSGEGTTVIVRLKPDLPGPSDSKRPLDIERSVV